MRYLGGKARIARYVAAVVDAHRAHPAQAVWEPFCGGLNVTAALHARGIDVIATDVSAPLMALLCAVRDGWAPPSALSRDDWHAARALPVSDPLHGFAMFGCSFGGIYASGYSGSAPRSPSFPDAARRVLLRDVPRAALLARVDFLTVEPCPIDMTIYCDPPYAGRTGYRGVPFDHARFIDRVQAWARFCPVLVSEFNFPLGRVVWERERRANLRGRERTHVERIYRIGGAS